MSDFSCVFEQASIFCLHSISFYFQNSLSSCDRPPDCGSAVRFNVSFSLKMSRRTNRAVLIETVFNQSRDSSLQVVCLMGRRNLSLHLNTPS